jgi:hypothetical protein
MWASGINAFVYYSLPQSDTGVGVNVPRINASKHKGSPYSASASASAANAALAVRADGLRKTRSTPVKFLGAGAGGTRCCCEYQLLSRGLY